VPTICLSFLEIETLRSYLLSRGVRMVKKYLYLTGLLLGVMLSMVPAGWTQPRPERKGPIITHAFAVEKGYYGYIWKIYIEAEDPNGDMLRIASVVDEPGYGHYPTDWIYLKPQYRKHFKGYIQWNTFSSKTGYIKEWTRITLKVSVSDKAGNESNEVIFPFTFESGLPDPHKYKLPAPFEQRDFSRLGYIMIDLIDPAALY
jgi:hypothetical protein